MNAGAASGASLFILGSCVSRDAFGPPVTARFRIAGYVARTSWGSAFADQAFGGIDLDRIASPFQRRMVELDTGKGLSRLLADTTADIILIDLIDERFDLFVDAQGAVCTVSPELLATGFQPNQAEGTLLASGSERFFEYWERGWQRLLALLRQHGLVDRVKVNRVFWSSAHEDGSPFGAGQTPARIAVANAYLERLYRRLEADLPPRHFVRFPAALMRGALNHRWGSSPFHYVEGFYRYMASALPTRPARASTAAGGGDTARVVLALNGVALAGQTQWYDLHAPQGAMLQFDYRVDGAAPDPDELFTLECHGADGAVLAPALGAPRRTGADTAFHATLPIGFRSARIGLRGRPADTPAVLHDLRVTFLPRGPYPRKPATILSVDVEALPGRADKDSVERLVFGRFGDGQAVGIPRLCDMFDRVGAKATFFVDYSTCDIHGEKSLFAAADMLKARGHDVQLHMHSEVLVRQRRWPQADTGTPTFDAIDIDVARACLEYGIDRFQRNLGHRPRIFRPGGMRHGKKMVQAVRQVGIEAVSSLYRGRSAAMFQQTRDDALIRWDNGVLEAPLDLALDPLIAWGANRRHIESVLERRAARPLHSILLHSTSLLFRALDNHPPCFTGYYPRYEDLLRQYLAWFAELGDFITYSDLLDSTPEVRTLALDAHYPDEPPGPVPEPADRALDHATIVEPPPEPAFDLTIAVPAHRTDEERILPLVPAPQLPLRLAPGQRLDVVPPRDGSGDIPLTYILSGLKAYLMRQRCIVPGGAALQHAVDTIFRRHPRVQLVIAQSVIEDTPVTGYSSKEPGRKTFVLDLPADFDDYRHNFISKKHRSDIERKERTVDAILPGLHFSSLAGPGLDKAAFLRAAELIEARLAHKVAGQAGQHALFAADDALAQWDTYRQHGEVVQLWDGKDVYAAALCVHVGQDCFFMASGHLEAAPRHSLGNILLYRLIDSLIARGVKRLHLGGGDFDYKSRYGAIERQLWNIEFARPDSAPLKSRVLAALEAGAAPALLELDLATPLENILGADFESAVGVDFNTVVENDVLGTDGQARRYQATSRDAFTMMMKHVPFDPADTFVDIGCGKGKMLYYAAQLGYARCVGMELAAMLLHQAKANFERLQLPADIVLMHRDAGRIPMEDLAPASLFYLYNPFSETIMRRFVACLLQSQRERPRTLRVVYCNALFDAPFIDARFYPAKVFVDGEDGWRFGHAVIYERDPD